MKKNLGIAIEVAKKAGVYLLQTRTSEIKVNSSIDKDIKLQADIASEKLIIDALLGLSPYSILSEESGFINRDNAEGYRWIVDPLDGSLNYLRGIDINGVSIGLWKDNTPVLGVIFDFIHNNLYAGIAGEKQAWCNDIPINVSRITEKMDSIITTGFPVYSSFNQSDLLGFVTDVQQYKKVRLFGSAAISLVHVAKGSVEAYKENNIAIWDVAAGLAIVLAAGGKVEYKEGKSPYYLNVFASNGQ